jgi:hypothetical protein
MSKSSLIYKDVAPGAEDTAVVSATGQSGESDIARLPHENDVPALATLERNRWLLDGTFKLMPQTVPFWSDALSGDDGTLESPPVITIEFSAQYSSIGVTLVFDTATGEYCSSVNIKWYQGSTLRSEKDFTPDDTTFFCENKVTSYDKIVITLVKTCLPHRRARLNQIIFGIHRRFYMDELRNVKIVSETDLASLSVPISTMTWNLDSKSDTDFMFQLKQPVEAWNDSNLVGVYYIDSFSRSAERLYSIDCVDALGVLKDSAFSGGMYSGKSAKALMREIVGEKLALDMDEVADTTLTGYIAPGTERDAIQQVIFAWGVCISTDGRESIRVFHPADEPTAIGVDRTYVGASISTEAIVTEVQVTAHSYTVDTNGGIEIGGQKYTDTETVYSVKNPDVTANDKPNVVQVTGATLISPSIGQAVAQRLYDYYTRRNTVETKFVWKGERLGDCVTQPTPWGTTETGNLAKMTLTLSNTVAADSESIGV